MGTISVDEGLEKRVSVDDKTAVVVIEEVRHDAEVHNMTEEPSGKGCIACGWTSDKQKRFCYSSHVKLIYGAHNRGVWSIGSDSILKERPNKGPNIVVKTLKYLANHINIPVPKALHDWVDREG